MDYTVTPGHDYVQVTLSRDGFGAQPQTDLGCLIIELYSEACPKTCEHVLNLMKGNGKYSYKGSPIHRIVKRGYIQGGDVINQSGAGPAPFTIPDETFAIKHDQAGIIGLANMRKQPHTAFSQFYITQGALPWLDGKSVAFGKVVNAEGLALLKTLDDMETRNERPLPDVRISAVEVL